MVIMAVPPDLVDTSSIWLKKLAGSHLRSELKMVHGVESSLS
jgi:hypothetical protein